jgi:hypothetical protein
MCVYVCMCVYTNIRIYVCVFMHVYLCMHACTTRTCPRIHTHIHQVTGSDHPFEEEQIDRVPENVRAFVGEILYRVAD